MPEEKLVDIVIDGRAVRAAEGSLLLEAARSAGFEIPSLCWHRKLSPTGACRLCVVKVEGQRGLVTSCSTAVAAGMRVVAFDEELESERRKLLDALREEVAWGSDGSHRDELEELLLRYGLAEGPLAGRHPALALPPRPASAPDESSPVLSFDPARCIKCFRCVKACAEVQGKGVLSLVERGLESRIAAGDSDWASSECDGCGECVQLCPTGALVERPYRAELGALAAYGRPPLGAAGRSAGTEAGLAGGEPGGPAGRLARVRTTCPYCGVGCQLELLTDGARILRSDGAEGLSPNDGRLCVKGRFGYGFAASPERLRRPLVREGGGFREASWDEALDLTAAALLRARKEGGPGAVAGYASAKCTNEENYLFQKLFRTVLGTNNIDYCTRLCHASTVTAMLRSLGDGAGSNSIEDYERAGCVLVIGNNMAETHPVTATFVKRGKAAGASLVVIDPKETPLVRLAEVWLQPRLGTDVALLNGMARIAIDEGWVDRAFLAARVAGGLDSLESLRASLEPYGPERVAELCGVEPAALREAARLYATSPRSLIATGMGLSQQTVGTNNVFALINLMLVAGQIGREGAGIDPPRGQNNVQGATDVGCSPIYYPGYVPASDEANRRRLAALWGLPFEELPAERGLTTVEIVKAAHEGKVRAMLVMGENPLHTDPNLGHATEAFERLDFLAVSDIFLTPSAALADVVFPAASWAEKEGTFANSDRRVLRVRRAVASPGEAREDLWILQELARRMGRPLGNFAGASEVWEELALAAPAIFGGIDYARLEAGGIQWPCPSAGHPGTPTLFLERFGTPDGLARLTPVDYAPQSEPPDADYPLVLNTGRILYHYHSATMSRRSPPLVAFADEAYVLVHPGDADRLGLAEGARVRITSRRGSIACRLRLSAEVREGELFAPFHFEEALVNRLTRDELDPSSKIAPFKYTAVRMERA